MAQTKIVVLAVHLLTLHTSSGFCLNLSRAKNAAYSSVNFQTSLSASKGSETEESIKNQLTRRDAVTKFGFGVISATFFQDLFSQETANAFPNKISTAYDDRPKRRGPQPKDLGVAVRRDLVGEEYMGLKNCGPAPNCFCSTDSKEDDPEHNIAPWTWPKELGSDKEKAFSQLEEVMNDYPPGQGNIDGGGFQIVQFDPKSGYMYVQFESLKAGYIDDLELAVVEEMGGERAVQVRSSSRVGYLDLGVNAKRLNYLAKVLQKKGWDASIISSSTHPDYVNQNSGY